MSRNFLFFIFFISFLLATSAFAITKVGNSDDGSDLEGTEPLTTGPIVEAREKAVQKLQQLNVSGIEGLGNLTAEVQKTGLFLAKADIASSLPSDSPHASMTGLVYARTIAQPYASTRFFPVAKGLSQDQLIALHIHEALHRSLPGRVREDEKIVAKITLAITAPDASFDSIQAVAKDSIPKISTTPENYEDFVTGSSVGYTYKSFFKPSIPSSYEISSLHLIHSHLYPFGDDDTRFGMGIDLSYVNGPRQGLMGPLGLSAHFRVLNYRGFIFHLWGVANLNTLSAEELKESPFGRDVFTLGIAIRKNLKNVYVENYTSVDVGGGSEPKIGAVSYKYTYGSIIDVKIRAGARLWKMDVGGFAELHLADYFKVQGGAFDLDSGRFRIFSIGPEMTMTFEEWSLGLFGRFLVDSTKNASFDYLGHLMGPGVSQGSIGASFKLMF